MYFRLLRRLIRRRSRGLFRSWFLLRPRHRSAIDRLHLLLENKEKVGFEGFKRYLSKKEASLGGSARDVFSSQPEPQPEPTSLPTHYSQPESRPHGGATG